MDPRQLLLQIRTLMRALVWTGTSTKVFGSDGSQFDVGQWYALLILGQAASAADYIAGAAWLGKADYDTDDPQLCEQELLIRIVAIHALNETSDPGIELPLVAWRTTSRQPGLLQVQQEVMRAIRYLGIDDAINIQLLATADDELELVPGGYARTLKFQVWCNSLPYYPPCRTLNATAAGSGNVSLTWVLPQGTRYDRVGLVLRYAAGSTAPTSATAGTSGGVLTINQASATVATGAGAFAFAIFASYDDDWPLDGTADSYSASATDTVTAT